MKSEEVKRQKVICENCKKKLGWRKKGKYKVEIGTIQVGQGKDLPLLSFCSERCESIWANKKRRIKIKELKEAMGK